LTSQLWANIYLGELDTFVKHTLRCRHYIRYVDDFLIFGDDKHELHRVRLEVSQFLERLRLRLHPHKQRVYPISTGVNFVGFVSFPQRRKLRRDSVQRLTARLKRAQRAYATGEITLDQVKRSLQSWIAHSRYADSFRLRAKIISRCVWRSQTSEILEISEVCSGF